ncbi:mannonate dehydratase [Pelagibacterium xiamenense]|uniref:mannonate dehydratase n=1 Tax=Pelagibacterium xiamenense TaxID=2901140 RepID=UPI001E45347E|nr:mannonate dehydratase [Pelagibacterium xiamenense]MCD7059884.1 mannonate dehydratase [Pelagibacterium xiamenense]
MYVGTQLHGEQYEALGERYLRQLAQLGVHHVCVDPVGSPYAWTRDTLVRHIDTLDRIGLHLDMVQLPMSSDPVEKSESQAIRLGQDGPERDRQIDAICRLIELLGSLGVRAAKYNFNLIGIPRTADELGRGGSRQSSFFRDKAVDPGPGPAGCVDADAYWERITYFLERVVPVAESANVQLACHPHDPLTPPGYRGVTRVLGDVAGLKTFVSICESPVHGLNFCQGTVAESLVDPDAEIDEVIRWFGTRGKIFNVHFRNIRGGRYGFSETFPDEGDMDMARTFKVYEEVGYRYMIMPDHVPHIDGAAPMETAFAFCFGYIAGLFQANGLDPVGRGR